MSTSASGWGHGAAGRIGLAVAAAMAVAPATGCAEGASKGADSAEGIGGLVGNPAPDFHVEALGGAHGGAGGSVSLKALRGQVVLVDFWGTFCEPCRRSFPKLQDLSRKYAGSGLQVVGISEDEAEDKAKIPEFASANGAKFVIGWDADRTIARDYKPEKMPSSFLIDRKGVVRYAHAGYRDGEEVEIEKEIQELLGQ